VSQKQKYDLEIPEKCTLKFITTNEDVATGAVSKTFAFRLPNSSEVDF